VYHATTAPLGQSAADRKVLVYSFFRQVLDEVPKNETLNNPAKGKIFNFAFIDFKMSA